MPNELEQQVKPILLYNDECAVCRRIGAWVQKSARNKLGEDTLIVRPIGADPADLRSLNPKLDIWDAYDTIHILMINGTMKTGGEAVAETLRRIPCCSWFSWSFAVSVGGHRPFQFLLSQAYAILSAIRPLFGCESCGIQGGYLKHVVSLLTRPSNRQGFTAKKHRTGLISHRPK